MAIILCTVYTPYRTIEENDIDIIVLFFIFDGSRNRMGCASENGKVEKYTLCVEIWECCIGRHEHSENA